MWRRHRNIVLQKPHFELSKRSAQLRRPAVCPIADAWAAPKVDHEQLHKNAAKRQGKHAEMQRVHKVLENNLHMKPWQRRNCKHVPRLGEPTLMAPVCVLPAACVGEVVRPKWAGAFRAKTTPTNLWSGAMVGAKQ